VDEPTSMPWTSMPATHAGSVPRPRIDELLDRAHDQARVVAVVAGAGYGKTTAVAAWARGRAGRRPVAWVDAGPASRAPGGLWGALVLACTDALAPHGVELGAVRDAVDASDGPQRLLNLLACTGVEVSIVLDDLHEVRDRPSLDALDLLIAYLPSATTLVVVSRWDPPLRLGALRLAGRLAELRTSDLAFDVAETHSLLDLYDLEVDDATARRLTQRVGGWSVALRLAATALAAGADIDAAMTELAGHEGSLARYLASEVFDRMPEAWREVLATVSLVDRCHPELAVALTDHPEAGVILEQAAADTGLFHPVPGQPGWLEAHQLARAFLRVQLESMRAGALGDLHHRAAMWFAGRDDWADWIAHAVHDPDTSCLADVVAQIGLEPLLRSSCGGQQVAAGIVGTDAARWPLGRPLALAVAVIAEADARRAFGLAEALRHASFDDPADERLRAIALARVWRNLGRSDQAADVLREAPTVGASTEEFLLLHAEQVLTGCDGASYEAIRARATDVLAQAEACGADRLAVQLRVALATLALIEGAPLLARTHAEAAALLGTRFGEHLAIPLAEIRVVRAAAAFELGQQERFGPLALEPGVSFTCHGPLPLRLATLSLELRQRWWDGVDPRQLLRDLSAVVSDLDLAAADPGSVVALLELELLLAESVQDLVRAERAVGRLPDALRRLPDAALLHAHLHRMRRGHQQARLELRPLVKGELTPHWPATLLRVLVLDAVIAGLDGSSETASLERAVDIGAATGRRLPFLELGADALMVLRARRDAVRCDGGFVDGLIAELELLSPVRIPEPLTHAEVRVLHRMASMATLQEIADGLHLSRNTVKTHAASIYRKLSVGTRRQAVARGRDLGLLRAPVAASR
jgi:LuxR family transcriptional regulator, maltose regulon positive regulatory protein